MEYNQSLGYAKMIPNAKKIFVNWDHNKMKQNFPCIKIDDDFIYLNFIYQPYKLNRKSRDIFKVRDKVENECNNLFEIISIIDMLCSEIELLPSNEWCLISYFAKYSSIGEKAESEVYADYVEYFSDNSERLNYAYKN